MLHPHQIALALKLTRILDKEKVPFVMVIFLDSEAKYFGPGGLARRMQDRARLVAMIGAP